MDYQVNEIFTSVQGEGIWTGVSATFIRLQGCPVGCPWCDTKYTWAKGGFKMSVSEIVNRVTTKHVVVTGGEPTLWDLDKLFLSLMASNHYVQLETSGLSALKGLVKPDWLTWSPKKNLSYHAPSCIRNAAKEVKWVVDTELEWDTVWKSWKDLATRTVPPNFVLMPEGSPPSAENVAKALDWLAKVPFSIQYNWRFGDRLQWRIGVR